MSVISVSVDLCHSQDAFEDIDENYALLTWEYHGRCHPYPGVAVKSLLFLRMFTILESEKRTVQSNKLALWKLLPLPVKHGLSIESIAHYPLVN